MPHPHASPRSRASVRLLLALAAIVAAPSMVPAQMDCKMPGAEENQTAPLCYTEPRISITPESVQTGQPNVPVTIVASDYYLDGGKPESFRVYLNDQDVTAQWPVTSTPSGSGTGRMFTLRTFGNVALSQAALSSRLRVRLCDTATPCPEPEVTYTLTLPGVSVGPDNTSGGAQQTGSVGFQVTNTGTAPATFDLSARCTDMRTGAAYACTPSPTSIPLAPGQADWVVVNYSGVTGPAGTTVAVAMEAAQRGAPGVRDAGWMHLVRSAAAGTELVAPQVSLVDLNTGATVDRGACVTVAVAPRGAYECGDLRVAHALPAQHTRGRAWAPVLLYNSQHAAPRPTVYVDVTLPAGGATPDWVQMVVRLGTATYSAGFPSTDYVPGIPRRMALQWDGKEMATGAYDYTVQVTNVYGAATRSSDLVPGVLTVVNRATSRFGAGWWVAGWEALCIGCGSAGAMMWVGGDGSTLLYRRSAAGQPWVATPPDGPADTLVQPTAGGYVRKLRGGGTVHFDGAGRHVRTVNRLGQTTTFAVVSSSNLLTAIQAPAAGTVTPTWTMVYDNGWLRRVDAALLPGGAVRSVSLTYGLGGGRVAAITDPDAKGVAFTYDSVTARINGQRDRRRTWTRYTYNGAYKLTQARLLMNGTAESADDIIQQFNPAEGRSVAQTYTSGLFMDAVVNAFTELDGPRSDVDDRTRLWLAERGAPYRIVDALGAQTLLRRGDTRFPALVTEIINPTGQRTTAGYTARGTVDTTAVVNPLGDGVNTITRYTWDTRWDAPTSVRLETLNPATGAPAAVPGTLSRTAYDSLTGNVLSQQQGDDTARRTTFTYYPAGHLHEGQLASVRYPATAAGTARDSLVYDDRGNLSWTMSPTGFLTRHVRDALGRDSVVYTPVDSVGARTLTGLEQTGVRQEIRYDAMGRDTLSVSTGPALVHGPRALGRLDPVDTPEESLAVHTQYDAEGAVLRVERWSTPDSGNVGILATRYEYDAAGRKKLEDDGTQIQTYGYDPAGNVVSWTTGRGHTMTTRYDALGRVVRRTVPAVSYAFACYSGTASNCEDPFPKYPNAPGGGLLIPEEWTHLRYDATGRMVHAENGDAIVERGYHPNGALKTDVLRLRTYNGVDFGQHVYALEYGYDAAGRTTWLRHPQNLAGSTFSTDRYTYDPLTGALLTATDRLNNAFGFQHDNAGQRTALTGPGFTDSTSYDREGRTTRRLERTSAGTLLHDERFTYDARGKMLAVNNGASEYYQWYSGLGMLVATDWENMANAAFLAEEFGTDPLGNVYWRRSGDLANRLRLPAYLTYYQTDVGRVHQIRKVPAESQLSDPFYPETTWRQYDPSGNASMGEHEVYGMLGNANTGVVRHSRTRSFYSADQRLRYFQENVMVGGTTVRKDGVWEEYRYDPLGRRVLVRSNRDDLCSDVGTGSCVSHLTRHVWAGDQLLWELRLNSENRSNLETPYTTGSYHGRVSYFHAGGIDRPLVIRKEGVATVIPHQNWRGQFARGTYPSGQVSDCGPGQTTGCAPIGWPGYRTTAWHARGGDGPDIRTWFGGLVDDMRDASGQMYRRNRYYDPQTGQFTQADPMGLAGGLNAYGFADGDPVSYSDPYGLSVDSIYVSGSAGFRRTVINGLLTLANRQPWFQRGYDAIAGSSTHHIYIREQPCRRGFGNCQGMVNRRIGYIDLAPNMNALQLVTSAGHELVHAMGDLSRVLKTGIDAECGREDSSSNGCIAYYDNLNRDALGVRNIDDEDGRRFARERGLPMWTGDDPMQREHRPAGTP